MVGVLIAAATTYTKSLAKFAAIGPASQIRQSSWMVRYWYGRASSRTGQSMGLRRPSILIDLLFYDLGLV